MARTPLIGTETTPAAAPHRVSRRGLMCLWAGGTAALAGAAAFGMPGAARAAPRSRLWDRWLPHDPSSTAEIDHGLWGELLTRYVGDNPDGITRVDYAGWLGNTDATDALTAYLASLTATPISSFNRDQQYAYWLNLYNALTIDVILSRYPVDTIRDIDLGGLFSNGPWTAKLIEVEGESLSLDDIEHRILRPIWQDPRIHYGVNCAAVGCPNLARMPYTAASLDTMLDQGARDYVNHPRGFVVRNGQLTVSSIYIWFREDFGDSDIGVIAHLRRYANAENAATLAGILDVRSHDYDWGLNDIGTPTAML